ncbi:DUF6160 family protein [Thalassolituus hydrocarboniclasticus]|uniref:DUF6160 domain-containing protein n=1 Tax=Thalassolituus hydrocarboniclasticus TaxID=2742796 RepID=A0ABY6A8Z5_9GAMM|nr:DUF6160 family protein [Thalassolituus hydrocarboniclasticus]UXD87452.1 hypothetical protein HUF19_08400 [Thalassolituus hydrocarboniclasticus]
MKFLKKASLAAAIAAAPFAVNAEMVALDDATMSATTGQAGVTIEIEIGGSGISVGEIEYIDEGSVSLQNLTVNNVANITQTIDVDGDGNLLIGMTGSNGIQIGLGNNAADTTGEFSAVALRSDTGETTELVNNLDMTVNVGASETAILNLAAAGNAYTTSFGGNAAWTVADLDSRAGDGSVAILSKSSLQITDMNAGLFGYTAAQAATKADSAAYGGNGNGIIDGAEQTTADSLATGSAVQVGGVQFYAMVDDGAGGTTKGAATIEQVIWAEGGSVAQGGGVYIQIGQIAGTLEVNSISMGQASIGSLKVSDINLAGMTQRIYGHN